MNSMESARVSRACSIDTECKLSRWTEWSTCRENNNFENRRDLKFGKKTGDQKKNFADKIGFKGFNEIRKPFLNAHNLFSDQYIIMLMACWTNR